MDRKEQERLEREALEQEQERIAKAKEETRARQEQAEQLARSMPSLPDTKDIRELALAVEDQIFLTYYNLMADPEVSPGVRKSCADALADRAKGRPEQAVTQTIKTEKKEVALEDVARMMIFAMRDAKERGMIEDDSAIDIEVIENDE